MPNNSWTDEETEILRRLWSTTFASQIAVMVNKTKNAVIGRACRLGLPPKKKGTPRDSSNAALKARYRRANAPPRAPGKIRMPVEKIAPPAPVNDGAGLHIQELGPSHCRAVIGRGPDDLARYCGAPKKMLADRTSSFCEGHHALYYCQPLKVATP